jgi:hypothetical protein
LGKIRGHSGALSPLQGRRLVNSYIVQHNSVLQGSYQRRVRFGLLESCWVQRLGA